MEISHKKPKQYVYCRHKQSSLIAAFFQLTHLLDAGVAVDQSIKEIALNEQAWFLRRVWRDVELGIADGHALSVSMQRWPGVFDSTLVALLRSGEARGQLSAACNDCQQFLEWRQDVKARITTVLLYPVFALFTVFGVLGFLLAYLVPTLEGLLVSSNHEFAWHAILLLTLSQWLRESFVSLSLLVVCVFTGLFIARYLHYGVMILTDSLLLKIPLYGTLMQNLSLSRYCEMCSRLYGSGISLAEAMEKSEVFIQNRALRDGLRDTRLNVLAGKSLSSALKSVPRLSTVHIQVLSAGEASGRLVEALAKTGSQQRQLCELRIERLEKLIGPVVLFFAGGALLWVVASLLGPIYQNAVNSVIFA